MKIRIAVTGHRTLKNEEILLEKVNLALNNEIPQLFKNKKPDTTNVQISYSLITLLAEGADRLVAQAVLDYSNTSEIYVVLPFEVSDYKKTFQNPLDNTFDDLCLKATDIFFTKESGYKAAGVFMVDNADVLLALWDSKPGRGVGGTKDIIDYALAKKCPVVVIHTDF